MDIKALRAIAEQNDIIIVSHDGHIRTPPHYFDSLRNAFRFYFNTFNSQNPSYNFYAEGLSRRAGFVLSHDFLDEENTVLTIVAFERFFELFIKNLLALAHENLVYKRDKKAPSTKHIINEINNLSFVPQSSNGKPLTIPFRETLNRFYDLIDLGKGEQRDSITNTFSKIFSAYQFFDSQDHRASLHLLNWYRDRILHNGNKLPSLWMLDYFVTQRIIPIVIEIIKIDKVMLGESLFYFTTMTQIDILERLNEIKYDFDQLHNTDKQRETYETLLYIGHLKELGRANMNMNLFMRNNSQATYEYNYKDPHGRGCRFAKIEMAEHPQAKAIDSCVCCGVNSMVIYQEIIDSIFVKGEKESIEWVKCYTCDYHIRYNVGDPSFFRLHTKKVFS